MVADFFVERIGEEREAVLASAECAAILVVAEVVELLSMGDGQGLEQDGVDEGENRGVRADAQG